MALCSTADIEALRQIDITDDNDPTILALIGHAAGILEGVTGRNFDPVTDQTLVINEANTYEPIWLAIYPLTAVAVTGEGGSPTYTNDTHYHWSRDGRIWPSTLGVLPSANWPNLTEGRRNGFHVGTTITYSGGFTDVADVPQALRTLCAQIAADLFDLGAGAGPAGVVQESLGGWSAAYQRVAGNLTDQQWRIARRFMRRRVSVPLTL